MAPQQSSGTRPTSRTEPLKTRTPVGLYDLVGNVYEWSNSCPSKRSPRDQRYDTNNPKHSRYWSFGLGKKFQYTGIQNPEHMGGSRLFGAGGDLAGTDTSNEYMPDYGFRVVRQVVPKLKGPRQEDDWGFIASAGTHVVATTHNPEPKGPNDKGRQRLELADTTR